MKLSQAYFKRATTKFAKKKSSLPLGVPQQCECDALSAELHPQNCLVNYSIFCLKITVFVLK